jgi:hypothetical protein
MKTNQDTLALQLLKAKQTFTFKACEMNDIREQVKIAKRTLAEALKSKSKPKQLSAREQFEALSGAEATAFYKANRKAILHQSN